jgi:phage regulator Rha-like protein
MQKNSNIKILEISGEPRISHRIIADNTQNQQKNVAELIHKYMEKLELFGMVPFETEAIKNSKNKVNEQKTYFLNEPQATLLLTFMRNNEVVINFKVDLVHAFFEMRNQLQNLPVQKEKVEKLTPQKSLEIVETGIQLLKKFRELNPIEQIELDTFHKNETSESLLEKFGKNFENSYFLPTELGKMTGMSGAEINLILEKKGFQFRDENGIWRPTSSGKEFCLEIGNAYNQLKWKIETIL